MIAHAPCSHERKTKHGKDRKGNQRGKCASCNATVTCNESRPLGDMRIDLDDAALVLKLLLEGMSIRAAERITGMKRDTNCSLVLTVGEKCDKFLAETIREVPAERIELDEIWGFFACKQKTAIKRNREGGDIWTWLAIHVTNKLILSHAVGNRDEVTCTDFLRRLNKATIGRCQVTSDGLSTYTNGVPLELGSRVDFAQLIKSYASTQTETRYSPAEITGIEKIVRFGNPDQDKISTSYSERLNLTVRMNVRRLTRLTNAHSKTAEHHTAMMGLFVAWYNYSRPHESLGKRTTPAMACGLSSRVWTIKELLEKSA